MKTYTDADVRDRLRELAEANGYREAARTLGLDHAHLYRMVQAQMDISINAAAAVGFSPVARKWVRA